MLWYWNWNLWNLLPFYKPKQLLKKEKNIYSECMNMLMNDLEARRSMQSAASLLTFLADWTKKKNILWFFRLDNLLKLEAIVKFWRWVLEAKYASWHEWWRQVIFDKSVRGAASTHNCLRHGSSSTHFFFISSVFCRPYSVFFSCPNRYLVVGRHVCCWAVKLSRIWSRPRDNRTMENRLNMNFNITVMTPGKKGICQQEVITA